jgi:hypothetical protein
LKAGRAYLERPQGVSDIGEIPEERDYHDVGGHYTECDCLCVVDGEIALVEMRLRALDGAFTQKLMVRSHDADAVLYPCSALRELCQ